MDSGVGTGRGRIQSRSSARACLGLGSNQADLGAIRFELALAQIGSQCVGQAPLVVLDELEQAAKSLSSGGLTVQHAATYALAQFADDCFELLLGGRGSGRRASDSHRLPRALVDRTRQWISSSAMSGKWSEAWLGQL